MLKRYGIAALAAVLGVLSCTHEESGIQKVKFQAVQADGPSTKTVLQADGSVFWSPGDAVSLFYGGASIQKTKLTAENTSAAAQTTFSGVLDGFLPDGSTSFWAVYPYAAETAFDGSAVTVTVPAEQTAVAGTFASDAFVSIATSKDYTLQFYNLCGGIKFSVANQGITSVIFKGNSDEILAGQLQAAFDENGRPVVTEVVKGAMELVLNAPEGGFEVGKWYYMVALPTTLSAGYTMTFLDAAGGLVAERVTDSSIAIKRAVWGRLTEADNVGPEEGTIIYYTSTDGNIVSPNEGASFGEGVTLVSNTYENGQGVMQFDGPVTMIGEEAFSSHSIDNPGHLKTIVIPEGCLSIGYNAFMFQSLEEIVLPSSLQSLAGLSIYGCRSLKEITLPENLVSIGELAFCYCESLIEVTIPQSVEQLGGGAFCECTGIERFLGRYASDSGRALIDGETLLAVAPAGLTSYTVPDGITAVSGYVFGGFSNLLEIVLPDNLLSIGSQAFSDCTGLTEMSIPESVNYIEGGAFRRCTNLEFINIPPQLTRISGELFSGDAALREVFIPENITYIGGYAFDNCSSLTEITIPASVQTIGENAFYHCIGLESVTVEAVTPPTGGNAMFNDTDCPIYVPEQSVDAYKAAEYWSTYADRIYPIGTAITASKYLTFTSEGLTVISLENVGGNAPVLYYSDDLDTWSRWDYDTLQVKSTRPIYICGDNASGFSDNYNYKYSTFTASGDSFGVSGDVMSLVNKDTDLLTIPNNNCFGRLFLDCALLTSAPSLPATSLGGYCYHFMFSGCTGLTAAPELPAMSIDYGAYHSMFKGCTSLIEAPALPATSLGVYCYQDMFSGCTSLTAAPELPAISVPDHCYTSMFEGCTSLTTAPALPATTLDTYCYQTMFNGCTSLEEAPELPATTLAEGCYNMMFSYCSQLVAAPELLASTLVDWCYSQMFYECSSLNYVKCLATDISAENCVYWWLNGVASQGTFVKAAGMNDWQTGESGIPQGWTVQDAEASDLDGRWEALRDNDDPTSVAMVALFAGNNLDLYIIAWGQHYVGTYQYADGAITYTISEAYQAYTDVTATSHSWEAGNLDASTLTLSPGYDWYEMDADTLAGYKEDLEEFSFQLQDGNASATSALFGLDLVFTKVN